MLSNLFLVGLKQLSLWKKKTASKLTKFCLTWCVNMQLKWFNMKYYTEKQHWKLIQQKNKKDNKKFTITSFRLEDIIMSKLRLLTN